MTLWDETFSIFKICYMKLYSLLILTKKSKKSKNIFKAPKKSEIFYSQDMGGYTYNALHHYLYYHECTSESKWPHIWHNCCQYRLAKPILKDHNHVLIFNNTAAYLYQVRRYLTWPPQTDKFSIIYENGQCQ